MLITPFRFNILNGVTGHFLVPAIGADYTSRISVFHALHSKGAGASENTLTASILDQIRKPLHRNMHKGRLGHLGLVGGHAGMFGAIKLAARASMRAGVGLRQY